MPDIHDKLQYGNNYNHWKILDWALEKEIFLFLTPTRHTSLNTKS